MEMVISSALTSIQPLEDQPTMGSSTGTSGSFFTTNDSSGLGESATMNVPPPYSYVEPGSYPHVLDRKDQPQEKLHRQRQQDADRKELEGHVLQQAGTCQ